MSVPHSPPLLLSFFFQSYAPHPNLHSFPTRRSSDLKPGTLAASRAGFLSLVAPRGRLAVSGTDTPARRPRGATRDRKRSEEHTSELQSPYDLVCRLLLEKKKKHRNQLHLLNRNRHTS